MRLFSAGIFFQINTEIVPVINPAITPVLDVFFQNKERIDVGPIAAPNPAHAKRTNHKI